MVHALPPGGAYELGAENGVGCDGRKSPESEAAAAAGRSAQMLTVDFGFFFFLYIYYTTCYRNHKRD